MKKNILGLILSLSIYIIILSACAAKKPQTVNYKSFISDMASDGIIQEAEKDWWLGKTESSEFVKKENEIIFQNKKFNCSYLYSYLSPNSPIRLNVYRDDNEKAELFFDATTEKFTGLHFFDLLNPDYAQKEGIDEDEVLEIAQQIAAQYINFDMYEMISSTIDVTLDSESVSDNIVLFEYKFIRYVNEWPTSDQLYICITSKGDLRTLHIENIGLFEKEQNIFIDQAALNSSIESKLDTIYSDNDFYSYEIMNQTLTYTPDWQLAVVSQIELKITKGGNCYPTGVVLTTIIND